MKHNSKLTQGSQEWLDMRKKYIGASDAPVIMGDCKFKLNDGRVKTPYTLWQEKLGLLDTSINNSAVEYGKRMEEPARQVYQQMTGTIMQPAVIFHSEIEFMMASLDGLSANKDFAIEIKMANAEDHEMCKSQKIPQKYYAQLQHQLACTGHSMMHYFSFHKGEGIIVEVNRDENYLSEMIQKEKDFWTCVENFEAPPISHVDFRVMDKDWEKMASDLKVIKEKISNDKKVEKSLEESLKLAADNESCYFGNFVYEKILAKGTVDYSIIPELKNINLDNYRKASTTRWMLKQSR